MTRKIHSDIIEKAIVEMIFEASFTLPPNVYNSFQDMKNNETSDVARSTIEILIENADIARQEHLPLCQDCGAAMVFIEIGQELQLEGKYIYTAINDAVAAAYTKFYLRKSIVGDPLKRKNTETNTPCFIHTDIIPGDALLLTVYLKGGGSENMTFLKMFRPTDSIKTITNYIKQTIIEAGPNPCPPIFLGIGIGGTADTALLNSKKAVLRGSGNRHPDPYYHDLELSIKEILNSTNIGPLGFGGKDTVAEIFIETAPTHIASLPVALNLNCHSLRFRKKIL